MNTRTPMMLACLLAAGTTQSHAGIFTWFAGSGMWENPAMWNGPVGQYPDSILDTATISGGFINVTLSQNLAVGTLNVLNGADVYSSGNSIFVNADTIISGDNSAISVTQSPSLRDFDTDTLNITDGLLVMYSGLAQFDEALIINGSGSVLGSGTIEMNSTTGNIELDGGGVLWAAGGSGPSDTLRFTRTDSSTSKLDWTHPNASLHAWDAKTLVVEIPYTGPLGGSILVSSHEGDAGFETEYGFIAAQSSEITFSGNDLSEAAQVTTPFIDSYGTLIVGNSTYGVLNAPLAAMRGNIGIYQDAHFVLNTETLILDSLNVDSDDDAADIQLATLNGVVSIVGGDTLIDLGDEGRFDLDGYGEISLNIDEDSSLSLRVGAIDLGSSPSFDGTMNIEGLLNIDLPQPSDRWANGGEIVLDQGEISGNGMDNNGIIRGTGHIDAYTINNGQIIADGGTLTFRSVVTDGNNSPADGIIRAQTGDLVMNMQANGTSRYFSGSAFVGDGSGIREVLQSNVNLIIGQQDGATGSLTLNSGFAIFHDFSQYGTLTVDGTSMLRTTGADPEDRIGFNSEGVNNINGTLEVDGETWFVPGAIFNGAGEIHAVSSIKGTYFQDGADLSDISFVSSGPIFLIDSFQSVASVNDLTMENTSSLNASMYYSDLEEQNVADKLIVQGNAALDGDLVLTLYPETDLTVGETVTILQANSITGDFDSIDDSGLGTNRRAFVTVTEDSVEVFITCAADLNADGQANFFDVSEFLAQFNAMDPEADLNDDSLFNFFDVSIFLSAFDLGC